MPSNPVAEDGAVARFLRALRKQLEDADKDRSKQLTLATKALDANDESSLLSRLVRETASARTAFVSAMNPELPSSPMAVLKNALSTLLRQHGESQREVLAAMQERQAKLEQEIRESLVRLEERKRGDAKSARGGFDFEEAVLRFVQRSVQGAPVAVDMTANTVGAKPSCKVGDQTIRFTAESIFAGSAIVIEAKRDKSYTVTRALQELELARGNRTANAGVLVMARGHAPASFPSFARFGNDILVVWDEEDEDRSLSPRRPLSSSGWPWRADRSAPRMRATSRRSPTSSTRIQKELDRLEKMRKLAESIRGDAVKLGDELRKGGEAFDVLLRKTKATLTALNVELTDAEDAHQTAVMLPPGSLAKGRAALLDAERAPAQATPVRKSA